MSKSGYFSTEAQRCRELAGKSALTETARRWLQLAADYESLAQSLDSDVPSGSFRVQATPGQPAQLALELGDRRGAQSATRMR
jgi:hypothetical protein